MRYDQYPLCEELAKRYVLGTMSHRARRRFSQLIMTQQKVQEAVWQWEQLLNPMVENITEVAPNEELWIAIKQRLGWEQSSRTSKSFFSGWLAATAVLIVSVFASWFYIGNQPELVRSVAILQPELNQAAWLVKDTDHRLEIAAKRTPDIPTDRDFELWMLPDGKGPVSLGLLPRKGSVAFDKSRLPKDILQSGLAVSIEPKGGSTTGAPTGPVILTAIWVQLEEA